MAGNRRRQEEELVATYADPAKRRHRIVLRGRLVLDLCGRRPAVLVAELSPEEGLDQARAAVFGGEFDAGYLARAEAGEHPLGRKLSTADLRKREAAAADHDEPADDERLAA
jgi:hypothetical protein